MRFAQALFTLLLFGCQPPTSSFVPPPVHSLSNVHRKASAEHEPPLSAKPESRALKRRSASRVRTAAGFRGKGEPAVATAAGRVKHNQPGETLSLLSSDGVVCLRNASNGSRVILVGVVHGETQSAELAATMVREVKPDVVMLELDADRLEDLPPGRAQKNHDGLSWFTPDEISEKAPSPPSGDDQSTRLGTAERRGRFSVVSLPAARLIARALGALGGVFAEEEGVSEMESAVREAQACGARVCLGDRDFEETKRRLVEAGLADGVDDERLDDPEALLHSSMSVSDRRKFDSFDLKKPETRESARRYYAALDTVCDPKALSAIISERDEVMAENLMALGGEQTTVALLGIFHVDGVERILMTNGWQESWPNLSSGSRPLEEPGAFWNHDGRARCEATQATTPAGATCQSFWLALIYRTG